MRALLLSPVLAILALLSLVGCVYVIERPGTPLPTALPVAEPPIGSGGPMAGGTPPATLATVTASPAPTIAVTPTASPEASPTTTPTATVAMGAALTPTPTPEATPTQVPAPTATPTQLPAPNLPILVIDSPLNRSIIREESVVIQGTTSLGASVSVRGRAVAAGEEGRFRLTVPLAPGLNNLDVFAINPDGQRRGESLTVTYLPREPFFLTITQPGEQDRIVSQPAVRLWGRTASDASVSVNGISIPVDQLGIFSTTIALKVGLNVVEVVAASEGGDTSRETLEITYQPPEEG